MKVMPAPLSIEEIQFSSTADELKEAFERMTKTERLQFPQIADRLKEVSEQMTEIIKSRPQWLLVFDTEQEANDVMHFLQRSVYNEDGSLKSE